MTRAPGSGGTCRLCDTAFSAGTDAPKISALSVAEQIMQALANDWVEVLADENTRNVKAALSQPLKGPS